MSTDIAKRYTAFMMRWSVFALATCALLAPQISFAQATPAFERLEKARVTEAAAPQTVEIPATGVTARTQTVRVTVLEGPDAGQSASFTNDYQPVTVGELVYVRHAGGGFDVETWSISDVYRLPVLGVLFAIFLALTFAFGGWQGVRGLVSLGGSLVLILGVLLPGIYAGYSPVLVSIGVATLIIIAGSYVTHGVSRTTTAAVAGMIITVLITGLGAYLAVHASHLSGFTSEHNVYLNFDTGGTIDMVGLLFGGIMVGLLGVLYDIAIGQAITVEELLRAGKDRSRRHIYTRAARVGKEHIGALINTLAIAYVGTSLPLLLLLRDSTTSLGYLINSEQFATEIIRILMGSIGLILAVPITTLIATVWLHGKSLPYSSGHTH